MNKDDIVILKSVQKNTEMAMKVIDTIESKVHDQDMALLLAKTTQKYSELHQRAISNLIDGKVRPYKSSAVENMVLTGGINVNTLLNTSTSHIAELMIKGSNMGITDMTKTLNHHRGGEKNVMEMAEELMEIEKGNVEAYMKYL